MHQYYLVKPSSALCNMRCSYCFYQDVSHYQKQILQIMDDSTMQSLILKSLAFSDEITYAFQGGEPTLAGIDFFKKFIAYVNQHKDKQKIHYVIQTNGYALNKDWIQLFKQYRFLVGISLDGPQSHHDKLRKDYQYHDTFEKIMHHIELLNQEKVDYQILTTLTSSLSKQPKKLYSFYKQHHFNAIQLTPCLAKFNTKQDRYSLSPQQFYAFYHSFFECWYQDYKEGNWMSVGLFDQLITLFQGRYPSLCGMLGKCSMQNVIEASGDVYPCDFYCIQDYYLGNIRNDDLNQLHIHSQKFIERPRILSKHCKTCKFIKLCHGQCHRMQDVYMNHSMCGYQKFLEETYQIFYAIGKDRLKR